MNKPFPHKHPTSKSPHLPNKHLPTRHPPLPKVDNKLPPPLVFFCKDCGKIVETVAVGSKFVYRCKVCNTKNVAFGTEKSIRNFYRIKEEGQITIPLSEEEKKAMDADKL